MIMILDFETLESKQKGFSFIVNYDDIEDYQEFIAEINDISFLKYLECDDYFLVTKFV